MVAAMIKIAWHGVSLATPDDWSLVGVSGDKNKGYFRADGPEASAVEVRWSPAQGRAPDLAAKVRELLAGLENSARKKRQPFSSKVKSDKSSPNSVGFLWRSDRLGQGRLVYCDNCDRVIIAQVVSDRGEEISQVAAGILASISDHRDDGWTNWALYGLEFAVPASTELEKQTMMSGYLSLVYKFGGKSLTIERWGLAQTLISRYGMREWYRRDALPDIKGYRVEISDEDIMGHKGLRLAGRCAGIKQVLHAAVGSLTLHAHPGLLSGYVWHCPESNRLFSVRAAHGAGDDIAERVRDTITCHE